MSFPRPARTVLPGLALLSALFLSVSVHADDVVEYVVTDALGNIRALEDEQGNVIERHDYLPFGEECTTGPCASSPGAGAGQSRKFTGKERDQETGLDYFGARYYSAPVGRFTTVDPVYTWNDNLLDPQRWNRYAYARNNPLKYNDPDGRVFKLVVYGVRVGRALYKGYDVYSTVEGIAQSTGTIFSGDARTGTGDRLLATGSLLLEISGVSDALSAGKMVSNVSDTGRRAGVPGPDFIPKEGVGPYKRPSGARPTAAQRRSVQGKPCVDCGEVAPTQVADHTDPLVVEHYRTGTNDVSGQRTLDAVQPHCPTCSAQQGGQLSGFSREVRKRQESPQ